MTTDEFPHPPGYPLAVLGVSEAVRPLYAAPLPEQMLLSAQLASALAGVLLVLPTYALGRMLFGKFAGFAAALLFQVLPVPARITSDGLSEGVYLLVAATARADTAARASPAGKAAAAGCCCTTRQRPSSASSLIGRPVQSP